MRSSGSAPRRRFGPLMADISRWFDAAPRHRSRESAPAGNYLAGAVWPPVVQHFIAADGWRATHLGIAIFCAATMLPLAHAGAAATRTHAPGGRRRRAGCACRAGYARPVLKRPDGALVHRRGRLLRGDGDAAGAPRRLLRRSRLRAGARRRDAGRDDGVRHRQPGRHRLRRRPHRRASDPAARLGAAGRSAVALSGVRQARIALRDLGPVRPVPGRPHPELRHHHPRIFFAARSRDARRHPA